jgi:hypothetical protein
MNIMHMNEDVGGRGCTYTPKMGFKDGTPSSTVEEGNFELEG